jgi:hypothetical protein
MVPPLLIVTALEVHPFQRSAYLKLATTYANKGLCREAAEVYRRVIEIDPFARRTWDGACPGLGP